MVVTNVKTWMYTVREINDIEEDGEVFRNGNKDGL